MSSILELEYATPTQRRSAQRHLALVPPIAATTPKLRLTRRGRLVVFIGALLAVVVLGIGLGSTTAATDQPGAPVASTTVTVMPGQTLWDIAVKANPRGQDVRTTIADIMKLNAMTSAGELQSGEQIAVPTYR